MLFKKIELIKDITRFAVNEYGLFYYTKSNTLPAIPHIDLIKRGFGKFTSIRLIGDFLLVQDFYGREVIYDNLNESVVYEKADSATTDGYGHSPMRFSHKRELLCFKKINSELVPFVHDVDKKKFTKSVHATYPIYYDNGIYLEKLFDPPSIRRFDEEGNNLWEHKVTGTYQRPSDMEASPNEVSRVLGLHNNLVWLADRAERLYALDIETGKVIHLANNLGPANYYAIDRKRDLLLSVETNCLHKININNGKFEHETASLDAILVEIGCEFDSGGRQLPIVDNNIIFYNKFKSVLGAINVDDVSLTWSHDLFETRDYAMIKEVEYFDGKLYVKDNDDSLHVFERIE